MPQTAQEIFELYRTTKYAPFLRGVRGTYLFDIENVGSYFVAVDDGKLTFDKAKRNADCVIRCNEQDFVDIVQGRRNLLTAVLQGRPRHLPGTRDTKPTSQWSTRPRAAPKRGPLARRFCFSGRFSALNRLENGFWWIQRFQSKSGGSI